MDFSQFAVLLSISAVSGVLVKKFKQPLLIGYIFAGVILASLGLLRDSQMLESLGKIGVTLLLFLVGLEMNIKELPTVGKAALLTGIGQIVFTFLIAFGLGRLIGFGVLPASYMALAVSFSSTIIIIKLLSEKNALTSLYGKVAIGFLLVQDLVAILVLLVLSGLSEGGIGFTGYLILFSKAAVTFAGVYLLSRKIIPKIFSRLIADSQELLFIVSIAWALGFASFVAGPMGFSLEIGGFLAGLALAGLPEHLEIASKTRPLRDFFLTLFFLSLGTKLVVGNLLNLLFPAFLFSFLVIVGNPVIVMALMGLLKFRKRTSFLAAVTVAQISEFSIIVVAMGASLGHLSDYFVTLTTLIAAITMTSSTYLILGSEKIFSRIKNKLTIFERRGVSEIPSISDENLADHIVLVGCYRTGSSILPLLKKRGYPYLIVDFNPSVYRKLSQEKLPVMYGDISDSEILLKAGVEKARLVISTIDNLNDNISILDYIKRFRDKPTTIFTSVTRSDAIKLYQHGASYVVVPDIVAGDYIKHILKYQGLGGNRIEKIGAIHFKKLIFT